MKVDDVLNAGPTIIEIGDLETRLDLTENDELPSPLVAQEYRTKVREAAEKACAQVVQRGEMMMPQREYIAQFGFNIMIAGINIATRNLVYLLSKVFVGLPTYKAHLRISTDIRERVKGKILLINTSQENALRNLGDLDDPYKGNTVDSTALLRVVSILKDFSTIVESMDSPEDREKHLVVKRDSMTELYRSYLKESLISAAGYIFLLSIGTKTSGPAIACLVTALALLANSGVLLNHRRKVNNQLRVLRTATQNVLSENASAALPEGKAEDIEPVI